MEVMDVSVGLLAARAEVVGRDDAAEATVVSLGTAARLSVSAEAAFQSLDTEVKAEEVADSAVRVAVATEEAVMGAMEAVSVDLVAMEVAAATEAAMAGK